MNINPTMSMNFGAKIPTTITKMTLPGRNVSKVNIEVASEIGKKVTALKYKAEVKMHNKSIVILQIKRRLVYFNITFVCYLTTFVPTVLINKLTFP